MAQILVCDICNITEEERKINKRFYADRDQIDHVEGRSYPAGEKYDLCTECEIKLYRRFLNLDNPHHLYQIKIPDLNNAITKKRVHYEIGGWLIEEITKMRYEYRNSKKRI